MDQVYAQRRYAQLSIIIPVYNAANTLSECIESIICEENNFLYEIILVNDGSTDSSYAIATRYAAQHPFITVLAQENKGAGAARNLGMKHAAGSYLLFIDSDDYLINKPLPRLLSQLEADDLDILVFCYKLFDEKTHAVRQMPMNDKNIYLGDTIKNRVFSIIDCHQLLETIQYPWNKVYKKEFIKKNDIKFSATPVHNDIFFNISAYCAASKIKIAEEACYVHRINTEKQQLTQIFDARRISVFSVFNECEDFLRRMKASPDLLLSYQTFKLNLLAWILVRACDELAGRFKEYLRTVLDLMQPDELIRLLKYEGLTPNAGQVIFDLGYPKMEEAYGDALLLSIVVPVYNVEKYIRQCLLSIARQTLPMKNYEVIIVDDKSSDRGLEICLQFEEAYQNFKVIRLPANTPGGCATPSNVGMKAARGKYIGFVDSDDFVERDMFARLLANAMLYDSDLAICSFNAYNEVEQTVIPAYDLRAWNKLFAADFPRLPLVKQKSLYLGIAVVPWRKIYKREFVERYNIYYPEGDFFFEDNVLHWLSVLRASTISCVNKVLVTHRVQREGQSIAASDHEKLMPMLSHAKTINDFLVENNFLETYRFPFIRWLASTIWILPRLPLRLRKKFLKELSRLCPRFKFTELKHYRKLYPQRVATAVKFYFQVHGYYYTAIGAKIVSDIFVALYKQLFFKW